MTKFEELTNDRAFMERFNAVESIDEARAIFAKEGVDLDEELSGVDGQEFDQELSEDNLESIAGGIDLVQAWKAAKVGAQVGVIARNIWDKKHGRPLSYPNWRFEW